MSRDARPEGFSRRHRFSTRGAFGPVLRGSRKLRGRLAIMHVVPAPSQASRLGVALTRRLVPAALDRNRVKRLAREVFRRHAVKRSGLDCVIALRERFDAAQTPALRDEIRELFDQAARLR
ncbi:MAG TPA: ribonuclease P protein component [Usitatibacter sp.]|nr:ribonuclease P protein component [Usitatibacter sp.]